MSDQTCWKCGKKISDEELFGQTRRFCEKCYQEHSEKYKPFLLEYISLKSRVMFERSMRIMEKANCDMTRYKKFAQAVERHAKENPELYRSADEMVCAVVLLEAGFDIQMNYHVGNYRVDVLIPELKVCFEVDGERHKTRKAEDGKRDVEIRSRLGKEWEVIHIQTKYIEENPEKVPEAIKRLYREKKEIRSRNGGFLPETYSSREKAYYQKNTLNVERITHVI